MKKLFFLLCLIPSAPGFSQTTIDPNTFAEKFAESVNKHIDIFPKEDLQLLETTSIIPGDEAIVYFIQLGQIPVSNLFIKENPKADKLLKELYPAFKPLVDSWTPEDDSEETVVAILDAMGKQTNGKAVQYLFMYCTYTLDD